MMTRKLTTMAGLGVLAMVSLSACGAAPSASAATYPLKSQTSVKTTPKNLVRHKAVTKRKVVKKHKIAPKHKIVMKAKTKAPQFSGIPDFVPKWQPPKGRVFAAITRINNRYIVWGDHKIAAGVPGIAATGPNAGALTVSVMNSAAIMQKYGGPAIPTSLSAVGAVIKPSPALTYLGYYPSNGTIPANGSVTGLSVSEMQAALQANPWLHVTPTQLMGAYTVAAQYTMAFFGNDPMASFQYLDPYGYGAHNDQSFMHIYPHNNPATDFTAPGYQGGILPVRQYVYQDFVNYPSLNSKNFYLLEKPLYPETQPTGDVVASAVIKNTGPSNIGSGLYMPDGMVSIHGRLKIGLTTPEIDTVAVSLIRNGNATRWYVTSTNGLHGNFATAQTIWRAPQGG